MADKPSVLFVCLGNICRSTMAEGVFRSLTKKAPYKDLIARVDSCGTGNSTQKAGHVRPVLFTDFGAAGYHMGDSPDERTMSTLEDHGINDYVHSGRKV